MFRLRNWSLKDGVLSGNIFGDTIRPDGFYVSNIFVRSNDDSVGETVFTDAKGVKYLCEYRYLSPFDESIYAVRGGICRNEWLKGVSKDIPYEDGVLYLNMTSVHCVNYAFLGGTPVSVDQSGVYMSSVNLVTIEQILDWKVCGETVRSLALDKVVISNGGANFVIIKDGTDISVDDIVILTREVLYGA